MFEEIPRNAGLLILRDVKKTFRYANRKYFGQEKKESNLSCVPTPCGFLVIRRQQELNVSKCRCAIWTIPGVRHLQL